MTIPAYLRQARVEQDEASARELYAQTRAQLAARPGLAYAAMDHARTVYLVTYDGREIGRLQHPDGAPAVRDWYAHPAADPDHRVGPFHTGRQAAAALLTDTQA